MTFYEELHEALLLTGVENFDYSHLSALSGQIDLLRKSVEMGERLTLDEQLDVIDMCKFTIEVISALKERL